MIRFFPSEVWKEFFPPAKLQNRYAVSNYGRLISFTDKMEEGRLLKGAMVDGYPIFRYDTVIDKKRVVKGFFVRKLVAENFLEKKSEDQTFVLLIDRNRSNNFVGNLKWATKEEMLEHSKNSPIVIRTREQQIERKRLLGKGKKLTNSTVMVIKKRIFDPNRKTRMKIIAKQFGISEMQLYRIKSGENWSHVTID
jgi:chorismate mutase